MVRFRWFIALVVAVLATARNIQISITPVIPKLIQGTLF
jgi:hypothetical protein